MVGFFCFFVGQALDDFIVQFGGQLLKIKNYLKKMCL